MLEEGFRTGVSRQQWGREDAAEGRHGEDEAAFALGHAWCDELGDAESGEAVNFDDSLEFRERGLDEGDGNGVGLTDVVD